jgi:hypothetical protein
MLTMTRIAGMALMLLGVAGFAMAAPVPVPEIDPGAAGSALALLSGAILIFRSSRKK